SFFNSLASLTTRAQVMKRAQRGLYGGKDILFGNILSFSNKKTRRDWKPNVHNKTYHSNLLGTDIRVRVTSYVIRCIDKAGSFDNYIVQTKDKDLQSELGSELKVAMKNVLKSKAIEILEQEAKQEQE
ncbi:hypothetical protein DICPUDRAFT_22474, partial [Dictyostelium purpureum]